MVDEESLSGTQRRYRVVREDGGPAEHLQAWVDGMQEDIRRATIDAMVLGTEPATLAFLAGKQERRAQARCERVIERLFARLGLRGLGFGVACWPWPDEPAPDPALRDPLVFRRRVAVLGGAA